MTIRKYIDLVEGLAVIEPTMPVVTLKIITADMKYILIDGTKVGALHKDTHSVPAGINSYRKEMLWSGEFEWNGQTIHVGRTKGSKELLPKVTKLLRSAIIRAAGSVQEAP